MILTAVPNTLYGFFLFPFPLFRNKLYLQLGKNMAILPLVSWCLLSQELIKNNPKELRKKKKKSWLHGAALGTAQIMGQGWMWQLAEWSAGICHRLIWMKVLENVWPSPKTWMLHVSTSAWGFIFGCQTGSVGTAWGCAHEGWWQCPDWPFFWGFRH